MANPTISAQAHAVETAIGFLKRREVRGLRPQEAALLEDRLQAAEASLWAIERWRNQLDPRFLAEVEG